MISNEALAASPACASAHALGGHFACSQTSQSRLTGQRFKRGSLLGAAKCQQSSPTAAQLPAATKPLCVMKLPPLRRGESVSGGLLMLVHSRHFQQERRCFAAFSCPQQGEAMTEFICLGSAGINAKVGPTPHTQLVNPPVLGLNPLHGVPCLTAWNTADAQQAQQLLRDFP